MNVPPVMQRHRSLRWLVPAGILTVAGLAATGVFSANASESRNLPRTSPAALLAAVKSAPLNDGFSGTILSRVSLGLPELPALGDGEATSMASLLTGSHTVQVWYGGHDQQRIALLGAMDETDVFRSGRQVWTWNSSKRVAQHAVLPATPAEPAATPSSALPTVTPSGLAGQALAALSPTTEVTVENGKQVADRNAYELVLTPRTTSTRIGSVHISVDGQTKLPLAVEVYARGESTPAIDVAYTSVRFAAPSKTYFDFSPPAGAKVESLKADGDLVRMLGRGAGTGSVTGSGWTRVVEFDTGTAARVTSGTLGGVLTPVSGSWGHGGLLESRLVSVLVRSDGRVFAGAVDPSALYAAAGAK